MIVDAVGLFGMNKRKLVLIVTDKRVKYINTTLPIYFLNCQNIISDFKKMQLIKDLTY